MRKVDYIILACFLVALVVLCFFQKCSLDIYFLVAGFVVAAIACIGLIVTRTKK